MKTYNQIKNLLKQEFLNRNWNHGLYIDVYNIIDRFIYENFYKYLQPIKKEMTKKSNERNKEQAKRKIEKWK